MSNSETLMDLVILVADKNMEFAIKGAIERHQALAISPISFQIRSHSGRDGGVRATGASLLRLERRRFRHALMVLDFEGSGAQEQNALALERVLDEDLCSDWGDAAKAIVIDPELDIWMWGSDNALQEVFRWTESRPIREWLIQHSFKLSTSGKPIRPKEALIAVLRECGHPRSSANYFRVASKISLSRCTDHSFQRFRKQLQKWFPIDPTTNIRLGAE
jgi:hypothetical protein